LSVRSEHQELVKQINEVDDPRIRDDMERELDSLVASVRDELLIETAYLIPTPRGLERLRELRRRGVRIRILTNSLASNDVVAAHAGYARFRGALLAMGVELFEMRPDASEIARGWRPIAFRSKAALHTKTIVFDRRKVLVGSLNLDPRSFSINTETGVICHSPALARDVIRFMDAGVSPLNAYRLELDGRDGMRWVWVIDLGTRRRVYRRDPRASLWKRAASALIAMFPVDEQL
jgi:putative cardiolipin synthase